MKKIFTLFFSFLNLSIITLYAQQTRENNSFSVFFIGDTGAPDTLNPDKTLALLRANLLSAGKNSAVVFLGDNIYKVGLPPIDHEKRKSAETRLKVQLEALKDYEGKIIYLPGNHDWNKGHEQGLEYVNIQERYIEEYLKKGNTFLPDNGCPGPVEVNLTDSLVLLVLDTEWWLYKYKKPLKDECDIDDETDFILQLKYALLRNRDKQVIIAAHHPMFSDGTHNGKFPLKAHIFPLTYLNKSLWIPLPVIGSIYPFFRKNVQDIPHNKYQRLKESFIQLFNQYNNLIYVAGHDHNLQHFIENNNHHVISGSGSKTSYVKKNGNAEFVIQEEGLVKFTVDKSGINKMDFITVDNDTRVGKVVHQVMAEKMKYVGPQLSISASQTLESYTTVVASNKYKAGGFKRMLMGDHYRDDWSTPVKVPIINLDSIYGGLTAYKRGGGKQTKVIRLKNEKGQVYVLRQVDKDPSKALPPELRNTIADDIAQDQISSSNPYGALVAAAMAEIAGVYHTNPQMVFVPISNRLGDFNSEFANTFCLLERRLNGDQSDNPYAGYSKDVVSTSGLYEKFFSDNSHRVDQKEFLKVRLLDMLIGDWDRHADQWTWATFKEGGHTRYIAIPKDRDWVFSKFDGLIPWIARSSWAIRPIQHFDYGINNIRDINYANRWLDKLFLTELTLNDWKAIAADLMNKFTDEKIEEAVGKFPPEIFEISGKEIMDKLRVIRNDLDKYAEEYYLFLNKEVELVGTDKKEFFQITRLENDQTRVRIYNIGKGKEKSTPYFDRTFNRKETKEIRIYGLGQDDIFKVEGSAPQRIRVRVIGGNGNDTFVDSTAAINNNYSLRIYDTPDNTFNISRQGKLRIKKDSSVNRYNVTDYEYDYLGPRISLGYNPDDGLFLGAGLIFRNQKWRKEPFGAQHSIWGNIAMKTGSFNIGYEGLIKSVIGNWDIHLDARVNSPNYTTFFYGLGNETILFGSNRAFHRVRSEQIIFQPSLIKNIGKNQQFKAGIGFHSVEIEDNIGRFISEPAAMVDPSVFSIKTFGSAHIDYKFSKIDNPLYPNKGLTLNAGSKFTQNLKEKDRNFLNLYSELAFYIPIDHITIAHRTGVATNLGDYEFYQANTLGLFENLRGFRRMRFHGETSFYQNTELRFTVADLKGYLLNGKFGLFGLFDNGRVWLPGENSNTWHLGYGGGVYFIPFSRYTFSASYSASKEDRLFFVKFGFMF